MKTWLLAIFFILCTACTSTMSIDETESGHVETIDYKNYEIGTSMSAFVGEQIISRKAFQAIHRKDQVEALNDFTFKGGIATTSIALNGFAGDRFKIAGSNENGNPVAYIPNTIYLFGISSDGLWDETVVSSSFWTSPIGSGSQYKMEPSDTRFRIVDSSTPLSEAGHINHELIFTGLGTNGITLLYREYTFSDQARAAFSQELVYPVDSDEIRFRNYLISVSSVNSSQISYEVVEE